MIDQEKMAFFLLGCAFTYLSWRCFQTWIAFPLAHFLLNKGRVRLAFWVRSHGLPHQRQPKKTQKK